MPNQVSKRWRQQCQLEAMGQCIPPLSHVFTVPPSGKSVWPADLYPLTTFCISHQWRIRKTIPISIRWSGSPPKLNHLSIGQPSLKILCNLFGGSFCTKLLTHKQRRLHILLAEVINVKPNVCNADEYVQWQQEKSSQQGNAVNKTSWTAAIWYLLGKYLLLFSRQAAPSSVWRV